MPGYAYPVGTASDTGSAGTASVLVDVVDTPVVVFTATAKTRINSILVSNATNAVLPVTIYTNDGAANKLLTQVRVLKSGYALQSLVSGDSRVETPVLSTAPLTEVVLAAGDTLLAACPVEDVITVTTTYAEGVS